MNFQSGVLIFMLAATAIALPPEKTELNVGQEDVSMISLAEDFDVSTLPFEKKLQKLLFFIEEIETKEEKAKYLEDALSQWSENDREHFEAVLKSHNTQSHKELIDIVLSFNEATTEEKDQRHDFDPEFDNGFDDEFENEFDIEMNSTFVNDEKEENQKKRVKRGSTGVSSRRGSASANLNVNLDLNRLMDQLGGVFNEISKGFGSHRFNLDRDELTKTVARFVGGEGYNVMVLKTSNTLLWDPSRKVKWTLISTKCHCFIWCDKCYFWVMAAPRGYRWSVMNNGDGGYINWAFYGHWRRYGKIVRFH